MEKNGEAWIFRFMSTTLSAPEIFIALVVAAHAAVLALRLSISLYEA